MSSNPKIAVIGAGAVGLSTAVQIQETLPNAEVTVIAEKFDRQTTSDGAAGLFIAAVDMLKETPLDVARKWFSDSFDFFKSLLHSTECVEAGISRTSGFRAYIEEEYIPDPVTEAIYLEHRPCSKREMSLFPEFAKNARHVFYVSTLMIEGRWLLPYLLKRFCNNGGRVERRKIRLIQELVGHYDVIVNCTGIGANELMGDKKVIPIRGQVIRVSAPWVKHFVYVDGYVSYIIPGRETITVGGTNQYGDGELNVREHDRKTIWETACKYLPSLEKAEWKWEWVGLRPGRTPLRLERETIMMGNVRQELVHNYGHGGNGMALCWGTGKHATKLVAEAVAERHSRSKL